MRGGLVPAILVALTLATSCGETNIQAIRRLAPRGDEVRSRLARIAARLPAPGSVTATEPVRGSLTPPFVLDFRHGDHTADVLMEGQLASPDRELAFDLLLSPHLLHCLAWTGPKNPLHESAWDDRGDLGPECERAFALPWLAVVRTLAYELPERIDLELFVVDLRSERVVFAAPIRIRSRYRKADIGRGRFASKALGELRSEAFVTTRCAIAAQLAKLPLARVDLSESWADTAREPCARSTPGAFFEATEPPAAKPELAAPPREPLAGARCAEPRDAGLPASLREVDWCNFEYRPGLVGLRRGRGEVHEYAELGGVHDTDLFQLGSVSYADLTGDGVEEALVVIDEQHFVGARQDHWSGTQLFVFEWRQGAPARVADASLSPAERVVVDGKVIVVTSRTADGSCDQRYELSGSKLVPSGAPTCRAMKR